MKSCPNCGAQGADGMAFCQQCGTQLTPPEAVNPLPPYQPAPTEKPKKRGVKWWHFVLLALSVIILVGMIINFIEWDARNKIDMQYDRGTIQDGVYINQWANLRYEIPDGWEELSAFETAADTVFAIQNPYSGENLQVVFEGVPDSVKDLTEKRYLEILQEDLRDYYADSDYELLFGSIYDETVAGESYKAMTTTLEGKDVIQKAYVRKLGSYMIVIVAAVAEDNNTLADTIIDRFEPAH